MWRNFTCLFLFLYRQNPQCTFIQYERKYIFHRKRKVKVEMFCTQNRQRLVYITRIRFILLVISAVKKSNRVRLIENTE